MAGERYGVVLFGDVVGSRRSATAATRWLDQLCGMLADAYAGQTLAPFDFTQGDELQGLLSPRADPITGVLMAALRPARGSGAVPPMRWAIAAGPIDEGRGRATQRTGPAFLTARALLNEARAAGDGLRCRVGDSASDELLDRIAPVLVAQIAALTDRQREVARLALLDGLRQSDIATHLGVSRPTISITYRRGGIRNLERLADATRILWRQGMAARVAEAT